MLGSSIKKLVVVALIVVLLVHGGWVIRGCAGLYIFTYDTLEPFRDQSPTMRYLIVGALVVLAWLVIHWAYYKIKLFLRK